MCRRRILDCRYGVLSVDCFARTARNGPKRIPKLEALVRNNSRKGRSRTRLRRGRYDQYFARHERRSKEDFVRPGTASEELTSIARVRSAWIDSLIDTTKQSDGSVTNTFPMNISRLNGLGNYATFGESSRLRSSKQI